MQISNLRAITLADEAGERVRPAFEGLIDEHCPALYSTDPAVKDAAKAAIADVIAAAIVASGIGAP
jgi:hypothetical protein